MALTRNQIQIGAVILEAAPFNWPLSNWDLLELRFTETTGWRDLIDSALVTLRSYYNGAHGRLDSGMLGLIVQYVESTGGPAVAVSDWRGNAGTFAFAPNDGLEVDEIPGAAEDGIGKFTGTIRLVKLI